MAEYDLNDGRKVDIIDLSNDKNHPQWNDIIQSDFKFKFRDQIKEALNKDSLMKFFSKIYIIFDMSENWTQVLSGNLIPGMKFHAEKHKEDIEIPVDEWYSYSKLSSVSKSDFEKQLARVLRHELAHYVKFVHYDFKKYERVGRLTTQKSLKEFESEIKNLKKIQAAGYPKGTLEHNMQESCAVLIEYHNALFKHRLQFMCISEGFAFFFESLDHWNMLFDDAFFDLYYTDATKIVKEMQQLLSFLLTLTPLEFKSSKFLSDFIKNQVPNFQKTLHDFPYIVGLHTVYSIFWLKHKHEKHRWLTRSGGGIISDAKELFELYSGTFGTLRPQNVIEEYVKLMIADGKQPIISTSGPDYFESEKWEKMFKSNKQNFKDIFALLKGL